MKTRFIHGENLQKRIPGTRRLRARTPKGRGAERVRGKKQGIKAEKRMRETKPHCGKYKKLDLHRGRRETMKRRSAEKLSKKEVGKSEGRSAN